MKHLAILGPGLLGGSLALAMRERTPDCRVTIWARRPEAAEQAGEIADLASTHLAEVVRGADTIVFCVPIGAMPALAAQIAPFIEPDALITDVGSVKAPVVAALSAIFASRGRYIGSHPMAGSEQTGLSAARADLFEGSVALITPHPGVSEATQADAAVLWELLGCKVRTLSPDAHDEAVGLVSHLPHLLAAALVDFIAAQNRGAFEVCGNGLRDTTRIASGSPDMWTEILAENRAVLSRLLGSWISRLEELREVLAGADDAGMKEFLTRAKDSRDQYILKHGSLEDPQSAHHSG